MANVLHVSTDFLMNGSTADMSAENITDKTLINQFNLITELTEENKTVVSKLIDAFLFQQEMKQKLCNKKNPELLAQDKFLISFRHNLNQKRKYQHKNCSYKINPKIKFHS
jgi:hypothetical protein